MNELLMKGISEEQIIYIPLDKRGYKNIRTPEQLEEKIETMLDAGLITYDCGHYIHHYKSDEMCKEIVKFVNSLER
jgi:hypothetical protein